MKLLIQSIFGLMVFLHINYSFAQTGPAGVGNNTGTNSQPKLEMWYDASTLGLTNNDPVSTLTDLSGNGYDLSQAGTARPTYKDASDANYGFSALSFDGTDDLFSIDGSLLVNTNYTVFAVAGRRSNGRNVILGGSATTSNQNFHPYFNTSALHSHHYGNDHNAAYTGGDGSSVNATTPDFGVFTYRLDAGLASAQRAMFQNGSLIGTRNNNAQLTAYPDAAIGLYQTDFSTLELAEIIIFSEALTDVQVTIVSNYLASKYGLTMDASDFYAGDTPGNGNFDFSVTGIGQQNAQRITSNAADGVALTANASLDTDGEFLMIGADNTNNAVSVSNLGTGVAARWLKTWYVDKSSAGSLSASVSFDLIEGIGGDYPAGDKDNYVLLRKTGATYDIVPVAVGDKSILGSSIEFLVSDAQLVDGEYTLGTIDATNSPLDGQPNQTWYSYTTTGNWSNPLTWTTDGSGLDRIPIGGGIPDVTDNIVILSGKDVILDFDGAVVASAEINGLLDVGASSGHNFVTISGNGKIRLSGAAGVGNFPAGNTAAFADDFIGGTVEYYGTGLTITDERLFNDVTVNLTNNSDEVVLLNNMTINGDFTISKGVFKINDNTSTQTLNLDLYGPTFVDANGAIAVGQGNTIGTYSIAGNMPPNGFYHQIYHQINFYNDFTNSGTVRFTNETAPIYNQFSALGAATVYFKGATNNIATLSGQTDFYNLVVDKGSDQTFEIEINASSTNNFSLYGPNNCGRLTGGSYSAENPEVRKALWIYNGTLHLTGNLEIPTLSEGNSAGGNGDYPIGQNASLWIDGANVEVYSTADNTGEVPAGAAGINTGGSNQALSIYGRFRLTDGHFGTRGSAGMIFWNASAGEVLIEGGTVNVSQFRSAQSGTGTYTYTQSGGDVLIRANEGRAGETSGTYDLFSLDLEDAVFNMSGGTLTVYGNRGDAIFINSKAGNYNVTGGTVIVENRDGDIATIASTAPFWNLIVGKDQAGDAGEIDLITCTSGANTITDPNLRVLNNFTINSGIVFDHNGNDVEIGSDFTIQAGADYLYDVAKPNTTTINGVDNSTLSFFNRTLADAFDVQDFHNLVIDKPTAKKVSLNSGKPGLGNPENNLLRVNGEAFKILNGTFDHGEYSVWIYSDSLVNYDVMGVYDDANNVANGDNDFIKFTDGPIQLITADTAVFGNVRFNNSTDIVALQSDVTIQRFEYRFGRMNLGIHNLRIDEFVNNLNAGQANWNGCGGCFSVEDMFITAGNVSDGGLSFYIPADGLDPADGDAIFDFPVGLGTDGIDADVDGGNSKYTPAQITLSNVSDDGYITIRPVDKILPTTDGNGGTMLSYYWRVTHEGFSALPNVDNLTFTGYEDDDGSNPTNTSYPNSWEPGKVLASSPFSRSTEDKNNISGHEITFNGFLTDGPVVNGAPTPFPLENADYSAGPPNRFSGSPGIYYTRGQDLTNNQPLWTDRNSWTDTNVGNFDPTNPHSSANDRSNATPGPGDIVNIGFFPFDDPKTDYRGYPHSVRVNNADDAEAAVIIFTQMTDDLGNAPVERKPLSELPLGVGSLNDFQFRPTFTWNSTGTIAVASIQGEGTIRVRGGSTNDAQRDPDFSAIDLGFFIQEDSSYLLYEAFNDYTINNVPDIVPNLTITNDGWGASDRSVTISKSFSTNQNLEIQGNSNLLLGNGTTGDITIGNDLYLRPLANGIGGGELRFANSGTARNITVDGDVYVGNPAGFAGTEGNIIRVVGGGTVSHQMEVNGDIIINTTGSNGGNGNGLQFGDGTSSVIDLTLKGATSNTLENLNGDIPQLHRVILDKGVNTSNSFAFNTNFTLTGPTNTTAKAIDLLNGTLVLNDALIDVNLTTGGDDFNIPSTSILRLSSGTVRMSGDDTGIALDGSLIIDGGNANAYFNGAGNGNNYIEYSSSGSAVLNISDGNLFLGSQLRRNTITTEGKLNYIQTGGTVILGQNAAPEALRGVLEIVNTGSSFTYTGGTLTLVRQNTASPTVASLRLLPTTSNVTETIFIGNGSTPASQNNFGINSNIPLAGLTISGTNSPVATLQVNDLTLTGNLLINTGATFNANGIALNLAADFTNDGTFIPTGNTTTFTGAVSQNLQGTGTTSFYKLTKNGVSNLDVLDNDITVNNLFTFSEGIINDNGNTIDLKGNAVIDGEHISSGAGDGLKFSSSGAQQLLRSGSGTSTMGIVTIANPTGLVIPEAGGYNFIIEGDLRMNGGLFNIGSSSVTLGQSAEVTTSTAFSVTNMVKTNSSFSDNGLTKIFPTGFNQLFTFPIGEALYTPVSLDFTVASGTSGTSVGSLSAKPANEYHPTVNDGNDATVGGDINNVLQYYWTLKSSGLAGFKADVNFQYDQSLVSVVDGSFTEANYIAARILDFNNPLFDINKFTSDDLVNEATNVLGYSSSVVFDGVGSNGIAGDYFAGLDLAIPNNVATYTSTGTGGNVGDDATYIESLPTPGTPPSGAVLIVSNGTEVNFDQTGVRLYKTIIEDGGVLNINNTDGHRLGVLEGIGTLKITSNTTNAPLPAADYGTFFSCTGGGLEYAGTGNYNVLPGISSVRRLTLSDPTGTGVRKFPNNNVTICEDLVVDGPVVIGSANKLILVENSVIINNGILNTPSGSNGNFFIRSGDLVINGGIYNGGSSGGRTVIAQNLILNGGTLNAGSSGYSFELAKNFSFDASAANFSANQALFEIRNFDGFAGSLESSVLSGDFTGSNAFNRIRVLKDQSDGNVILNNDIEINVILELNDGKIISNGNEVILGPSATVSPANGRSNSYITGKVSKEITSAGGNFTFPIGSANMWRPAVVKNVSAAGLTWEAQFWNGNVVTNTIATTEDPTDPATIKNLQLGEYWIISDGAAAPPGVTANVGLSWGIETDVSAVSAERQELKVMVWNSGVSTWDNLGGTNYSAGNTQSQGRFEATATASFSENIFIVGSGDVANPLPVELVSFTAEIQNKSIQLDWITATEKDNDFFEVQRSFDEESFETIGIVEGNGTVSYEVEYEFRDVYPLNGRSFYRLKQVDYDGDYEYSPIVTVNLEVASNLRLFPNPTTDQAIYLTLDGFHNSQDIQVRIFNLQGRDVFNAVLSPDKLYRKPVPIRESLKPGIYIVEVNQGNTMKQVRLAIK